MTDSFSRRMWNAVAFIESGREHSRQLDDAFENNDGDAMCAALHTLAQTRPKLAANLPRYVSPIHLFENAQSLMGKSMREIRAAAKAQREQGAIDIQEWAEERKALTGAQS